MTGSTYSPQRWEDLESAKVVPNVIGIAGTMSVNSTTVLDTLIPDDNLLRGIELAALAATFGDTISLSIVDKDGVYLPANTVMATPVSGYEMVADVQKQASYDAVVPKKILGGTYLRVSYVSTGLITPVKLELNLLMLKVLV